MEKKIKIQIMNRTGHQEVEVDFEGAVDLIRKEMGVGKWLKIDARTIVTSVEVFNRDLEALKASILAADELVLMAGLRGGAPSEFRFDAEGYDCDGYDVDGYDRDGYDRDGYDYEGYNVDGYDRDGYDRDGYNIKGDHRDALNKDNSKVAIQVKIVKNPDNDQIIVATKDHIIVNNAFGREAMAEAWARLNLGLAKTMPQLLSGKAVVVAPDKK